MNILFVTQNYDGIGKEDAVQGNCRIEMLGGVRVVSTDRVISRFRTHKTAALLAYLALYLRQTHPREILTELFWPDLLPEDGRNNLSTALSSLRRQIEPTGVPAGSDE